MRRYSFAEQAQKAQARLSPLQAHPGGLDAWVFSYMLGLWEYILKTGKADPGTDTLEFLECDRWMCRCLPGNIIVFWPVHVNVGVHRYGVGEYTIPANIWCSAEGTLYIEFPEGGDHANTR